jgi:hypothetical protein
MPKSEKRKKKSKKGLSTEDILKIIKKLKPKTQQIVKVNIGDKGEKKKGSIQASYNPPFVFPTQGYPAITSIGQPAFQQPLMEPPRQAASWLSQPVKTPAELMPPPAQPPLRRAISNEPFISPTATPRLIDISESEFSEVETTSKKGKGYTVRAPRVSRKKEAATQSAEEIMQEHYMNFPPPDLRFNAPKTFSTSNLSSSVTIPTHFSFAVQNDKYQEDIIHTDNTGDQIGTIANPLTSAEWTGTPQGDITLSPEETATIVTAEEVASPEDVFLEEPISAIEKTILPSIPVEEVPIKIKKKKETLSAPATLSEVGKTITPEVEKSYTKSVKAALPMIAAVNDAIEKGFKSVNMPTSILYSKGSIKGFVKKDTPAYLLAPIYQEVLEFNK